MTIQQISIWMIALPITFLLIYLLMGKAIIENWMDTVFWTLLIIMIVIFSTMVIWGLIGG